MRPDGRRIAFVTDSWSRDERAPADLIRTLAIDLKPNPDGKYEEAQLDTLLRTILTARSSEQR